MKLIKKTKEEIKEMENASDFEERRNRSKEFRELLESSSFSFKRKEVTKLEKFFKEGEDHGQELSDI